MTKISHNETNPYNARRLVQYHDREAWWSIRRRCRWREAEMDRVYGLPFTRKPHPSYGEQRDPGLSRW